MKWKQNTNIWPEVNGLKKTVLGLAWYESIIDRKIVFAFYDHGQNTNMSLTFPHFFTPDNIEALKIMEL